MGSSSRVFLVQFVLFIRAGIIIAECGYNIEGKFSRKCVDVQSVLSECDCDILYVCIFEGEAICVD